MLDSVLGFSVKDRCAREGGDPVVMGVLNVTPDSFSDGGRFKTLGAAYDQAMRMLEAGANIIDVGGESTRPGAEVVSVQEEIDRVVPVIDKIVSQSNAFVSVDSSKLDVMRQAVNVGASLLNDVSGFAQPGALAFAVEYDVPICIMHMQGSPQTMQNQPRYAAIVEEVLAYLAGRIAAFEQLGGKKNNVLIDPGFGFGKNLTHNLALFKHLPRFCELGAPILVGVSRKSMFGDLLGLPVGERGSISTVAAAMLIERGAAVVRVHDVAEAAQAARLIAAVRSAS